jgi:hypothetical protein
LRKKTIGIFQKWLEQENKISKRDELVVLGMHLYQALFRGNVAALFEKTLNKVPKGKRLRVQLSFQAGAADLASWPWEFLYRDLGNDNGYFFATNIDLVLSRYVPLSEARQSLKPEESPLRILVVIVRAEDEGTVSANDVIVAIEKLKEKYPVLIETWDQPTLEEFEDKLEEVKPHVLHIISHGRFNKLEKRGEIALLNPKDKTAQWYEEIGFAEHFKRMSRIPHLLFLHLCEGGQVGKGEFDISFGGLAPRLISAGIPAVVAMQYPIKNEAAKVFCRAFYGELAKGESVDNAVQEGRYKLTQADTEAHSNRVFGTPVLYMRSCDSIIFPAGQGPPKDKAYQVKESEDTKQAAPVVDRAPGFRPDTLPPDSIRGGDRTKESGAVALVILRSITDAALAKLKEMALDQQQESEIYKRVFFIQAELFDKRTEEIRSILARYYAEEVKAEMRDIIWEMIRTLG